MTEFQSKVIELANQGYTVSEVAKMLNVNTTSVSSVRVRFNLVFKKKYEPILHDDYLSIIDTDRKAYFLGFFIADGCLCVKNDESDTENRISFNLQQEDDDVLKIFKEEIGVHNHISYRHSTKGAKNRKPQAMLRFTCHQMIDDLINKYNVKPRKTYNCDFEFPFNNIPENLWGSFLRGFIDGDGNFESHGYVFTPTLVGTSRKWLMQIAEIIYQKTGLGHKISMVGGKTCNYYYLRFNSNRENKFEKITKLYHFLYDNDTISFKRKKDKIESYLEYRANQIAKHNLTV